MKYILSFFSNIFSDLKMINEKKKKEKKQQYPLNQWYTNA